MEHREEQDFRYFLDDLKYDIYRSYKSKNRITLLLKMYIYIGITTAVIGGLYFLFSLLEYRLDPSQRITLIISSAGLFIAVLAKVYIELLKEREKEQLERKREFDKISSFLLNWATLERTVMKFFDDVQIQNNKFAIGQNLEYLFRKGVISDRDYLTVERALDIRNSLVHGKMNSANDDLDKYSQQLNEIIDKILIKSKKHKAQQ